MMRTAIGGMALAAGMIGAGAWGQGPAGYRLPPPEVVRIIDAPPTPTVSVGPTGRSIALVEAEGYPPIRQLARPILRLAGVRIDPKMGAQQRTGRDVGIAVVAVDGGAKVPIRLPEGARIGAPSWSPDGSKLAFARDLDDGVELWVADAATGAAQAIPGLRLVDVLGRPFAWVDGGKALLVHRAPPDRGPAPPAPDAPSGPNIEETAGRTAQVATYQDLLRSPRDEELFAHYATNQLARVDAATGAVAPIGEPGLIAGAEPSPDGKYLLVTAIKRPFSYRVPYSGFARTVAVLDAAGRPVRTVADLPVADDTPRQGVPRGPRAVDWVPTLGATLIWAEALDGGDPTRKADHRDALLVQAAPFADAPRELLKVKHRFAGLAWLAEPGRALLTESDRDRRWRTTTLLDLDQPADRRVVFDLSAQDAYGDPGTPMTRVRPDGQRTILQDGRSIYLAGRGASDAGDRPFLDRMDLDTLKKDRMFRCAEGAMETPLGFVGEDRSRILLRRESKAEPPNVFAVDLKGGARVALTDFKDPAPELAGITKELLKYRRADGVPLSGTLYLPAGYRPGTKLPLIVWAYPLEYSDASTAGQVRGSADTFSRPRGDSPLFFLTRGYAVLMDATMPVVGSPETMNDTYVDQVVASARAAIEAVDARGAIDPRRVGVGGHSYGAFMTANLLAHSDLFAAGFARSGAYNRTLTPFGFQSERRSFWEAPDLYLKMSPFAHADKINEPLLLIHGEADNNSGTFPIQSERMFQAIKGTGGTARLVLLPHESHGYRGRESILHVLAEMFDWADQHVKDRPTPGG